MVTQRPTWSCGHPVSPNPTLDEARAHVTHAAVSYQEEQLAKHAEAALLGGSVSGFTRCAAILAHLKRMPT